MPIISSPLNPHNAIESATFVVGFAKGLPKPTIEQIRDRLRELSAELPGESSVGSLQMGAVLGNSVNQFAFETPEAARFVAKPDGTHAWSVQAVGNLVQVQCFDYTNFAEVWTRAKRYLLCALPALEGTMPVMEVGFQVIDKFTYPEGADWNDYELAELYQPASELLTPKASKSGALWHVFQGWFAPASQGRVLHQLNISNTILQHNQQLCAVIDHRGALRTPEDHSAFLLGPFIEVSADGSVGLDEIFEKLHDHNRDTIEALLTAEKLQQIGIAKTGE